MKPALTWILVADASRARLFANRGPGTGLQPATDHDFAQDLPAGRDLVSDRPGRAFDSTGQHRHAMEPSTDPRQVEEERFLRAVASFVEAQALANTFDRLVVVAPPKALGSLRGFLGDHSRRKIHGELAKDLTMLPEHDLADHLAGMVRL